MFFFFSNNFERWFFFFKFKLKEGLIIFKKIKKEGGGSIFLEKFGWGKKFFIKEPEKILNFKNC